MALLCSLNLTWPFKLIQNSCKRELNAVPLVQSLIILRLFQFSTFLSNFLHFFFVFIFKHKDQTELLYTGEGLYADHNKD